MIIIIPHELDPHCTISVEFPIQSSPSCAGVGLVQLLVLFCLPLAHGPLQDDVVVHAVHPPCIGAIILVLMVIRKL